MRIKILLILAKKGFWFIMYCESQYKVVGYLTFTKITSTLCKAYQVKKGKVFYHGELGLQHL